MKGIRSRRLSGCVVVAVLLASLSACEGLMPQTSPVESEPLQAAAPVPAVPELPVRPDTVSDGERLARASVCPGPMPQDWLDELLRATPERDIGGADESDLIRVALHNTHLDAGYLELQRGEQALLSLIDEQNQAMCVRPGFLHYLLKLNQGLQRNKSEVVLLRRKTTQQEAKIRDLERKIEALTRIEERMKEQSVPASGAKPEPSSEFNGGEK